MQQSRNLTGVPSIWGDLGLAGQNMQQLSEAEQLAKKKKLMAGGRSGDMTSALSALFGARLGQTGSMGV